MEVGNFQKKKKISFRMVNQELPGNISLYVSSLVILKIISLPQATLLSSKLILIQITTLYIQKA